MCAAWRRQPGNLDDARESCRVAAEPKFGVWHSGSEKCKYEPDWAWPAL